MFANSLLRKTSKVVVRQASFKPKTTAQVWLSDRGAYPVMVTLGFAIALGAAAIVYIPATTPDMRVFKTSRKTLFRGELVGQDKEEKKRI